MQKGYKLFLRRIEAVSKERDNVRSTRHQVVVSLLTFVAADGPVLLSVYILKGWFGEGGQATVNASLEKALRVTRGPWPRYFVWNDSGYLDADIFKSVVVRVADDFHAMYPGLSSLLSGYHVAPQRRADTF